MIYCTPAISRRSFKEKCRASVQKAVLIADEHSSILLSMP